MDVNYFVSKQYEEVINKKMMYYDYVFPEHEVVKYTQNICEIPIANIVNTILDSPNQDIKAIDVFQFSSFEDATTRICYKLIEANNPGLKHRDIGKLLLDDGRIRNDLALTKYGENHAKMGTSLGLLQELSKTYFLTCIGYVFPKLDDDVRNKLLIRLILRNGFIGRIIKLSNNGNVNMRQFLYMLSDSTYKRRSSNVRAVLNVLNTTDEYDFTVFTNNLFF